MLASANSFQRALQHQELRKDQFGSPDPPGFYVQVVKDETGFNKLKLIKGDAAPRQRRALRPRRRRLLRFGMRQVRWWTRLEALRGAGLALLLFVW